MSHGLQIQGNNTWNNDNGWMYCTFSIDLYGEQSGVKVEIGDDQQTEVNCNSTPVYHDNVSLCTISREKLQWRSVQNGCSSVQSLQQNIYHLYNRCHQRHGIQHTAVQVYGFGAVATILDCCFATDVQRDEKIKAELLAYEKSKPSYDQPPQDYSSNSDDDDGMDCV